MDIAIIFILGWYLLKKYKHSKKKIWILGWSNYSTCIRLSTEFSVQVPADHGTCENWTLAAEANAGNCTKTGKRLHCFGGMANLHLMK